MKNVVVTGSAGFIGGYLVEELLRTGYSVTGVDNYSKYGPVDPLLRLRPELPPGGAATCATRS